MGNRVVKFRGKRADNGDWVFGSYVKSANDRAYIIIYATEDAVNTGNEIDFLYTNVIPETIGQYTGLQDKNGVEIYEGDILKSNLCSHLFVVKFGEHGYSAYTDCVELGFYAHCTDEIERNRGIREDLPFWAREAEAQVIGNIHDQEGTR